MLLNNGITGRRVAPPFQHCSKFIIHQVIVTPPGRVNEKGLHVYDVKA